MNSKDGKRNDHSIVAYNIVIFNETTVMLSNLYSNEFHGYRDRVVQELKKALHQLECDPSDEAVDVLAALIFHSMTTSKRVYHAIPHIFDLITEAHKDDPIHVLAALFHDIVYLAIDHQLSEQQAAFVRNIVEETTQPNAPSRIRWIGPCHSESSSLIYAVDKVFDLERNEDDEFTAKGLNEFLSALIMTKALEEHVPLLSARALFEIILCIEATIPFRPILEGKTAMERLYDKACLVRAESLPNDQDLDLIQSVQRAAVFANCDLRSFYSPDRDFFFDSSFKLFPESFPVLLTNADCLLSDLLKAMLGYYGLCQNLDINRIFCYFQGAPTPTVLEEMRRVAKDNLGVIYEYLTVRILTVSIVLALTRQASDGTDNARVSFYQLLHERVLTASTTPTTTRPLLEEQPVEPEHEEVLRLLVTGRHLSFTWDSATAPLDAVIYQQLGMSRIKELLQQHVIEASSESCCDATALLKALPSDLLNFLVDESSEVVEVGHRKRLGELKQDIGF